MSKFTKGPWEFDATNYGVCTRQGYGLLKLAKMRPIKTMKEVGE